MTTSSFAWLDYDDGDRRRMAEVINLFREKGTLDELGIGTIRDTFADLFFPGTSTVQTRARYFLFVPWLFGQLENGRVSPEQAERRIRELHGRLVQSLRNGGEGAKAGLIGIEAGENIQRLPSSIYWQGLGRWGVRLFSGSAEQFYRSLGGPDQEHRIAKISEGGEPLAGFRGHWHASLPPAPAALLAETTFTLTRDEAEFLAERIRHACGDSLLAACLTSTVTRKRDARAPWELGGHESLPIALRTAIEDARRYSLVMEGAVLVYNLMLAELVRARSGTGDSTGVDRYGAALERWGDEMTASADAFHVWAIPEFWDRLLRANPRLPPSAIRFSTAWMTLATSGPRSIRDSEATRALISARERRLKGGLARLHNPRALENWSGESGLGRLTYRWGSAQRILLDIRDGLRQPAGGR